MTATKTKGTSKGIGDADDRAGDGGIGIGWGNLGLEPLNPWFLTLAEAIIAAPPSPVLATGENGRTPAQSNLYWAYNPHIGLMVEASAGFLNTSTGNGGFHMTVGTDGSWSLRFDESAKAIGSAVDADQITPLPPTGNTVLKVPGTGAAVIDASVGHTTVDGGTGWDTIQGGVGDYMIGGSGTHGGGLAGQGNCAVYTASPGSVLVDMQNGFGYGGNADATTYVNMNQVRGSLQSNVLIGNQGGTDLKSGGDNSLLISTGGSGFELRPDGRGNVLVSTVGADRVLFDPTHGWALGDDNVMLGFDVAHHDFLDLSLLTSGKPIKVVNGSSVAANFHAITAAGYNPATGTGDINDYVRIADQADGSHVIFSPTGSAQSGGTELIDLKFVHGLNVQTLYQNHNIVA